MNDSTQTTAIPSEPIHPRGLLNAIPNFGDYRTRTDALVLAQQVLLQAGIVPSVYPKSDKGELGLRSGYEKAVRTLREQFKLKEGQSISSGSQLLLHERDLQGLAIEVITSLNVNFVQHVLDEYDELPNLIKLFSAMNARQRAEALCATVAVRAGMEYENAHAEDEAFTGDDESATPSPATIEALLAHDETSEAAAFLLIQGLMEGKYNGEIVMRLVEACFKSDSDDEGERAGLLAVTKEVNARGEEVTHTKVANSFGSDICLDMLAPTSILSNTAKRMTQILTGYCYYGLGKTDALQAAALERYKEITPDPTTITVDNAIDTCFILLEQWMEREIERRMNRSTLNRLERLMRAFGIDPSNMGHVSIDDDDDDKDEDNAKDAQYGD